MVIHSLFFNTSTVIIICILILLMEEIYLEDPPLPDFYLSPGIGVSCLEFLQGVLNQVSKHNLFFIK